MSVLIAHQVSLCGFLAVLLLIALSNLLTLRRLGRDAKPSKWPRISVLVPARNEAGNIGPCLQSLLAQDYPDLQVVALDDDSSDATWQILTGLSEADHRLQVLRGRPLPAGWLGKHWACHQLAQAADGEFLLFTDADTRHRPETLRAAMATMEAGHSDILSCLVREEAVSCGEKLIVPIMWWAVLSFLPLALAYRARVPILSAAQGQFMLFRRQSYERIGGHAASRNHVADDLALMRRVVSCGLRWRLCDASRLVSCRMYRGFAEAFRGFSKSLFPAFDYNAVLYVAIWSWLGVVFFEPPIVLALGLLGAPTPEPSALLAALAIGLSLLLWAVNCWQVGLPAYLPLFYPLIMLLAEVIAARSLVLTMAGRATWKGRTLEKRD